MKVTEDRKNPPEDDDDNRERTNYFLPPQVVGFADGPNRPPKDGCMDGCTDGWMDALKKAVPISFCPRPQCPRRLVRASIFTPSGLHAAHSSSLGS
mmetsp:Transcript_9332/g.13807  ORF Transcript_9332/g.13807 Transcript_9332/m.13807 type:complete len:96 (-) Transcript_9332:50-337(-)